MNASLSVPAAAIFELLAHLGIAPLAELRWQSWVFNKHSPERINAKAKLDGAEMHVAQALAKDPLIDAQYRPGPLRR